MEDLNQNNSDSLIKRGEQIVPKIKYDDWKKVEIKIGQILSVEKIDKSEKLLKLLVDFKEEKPRQIISGIAKFFPDINILLNKKCAFVTNLEPKPLMGLESNGMILAVSNEQDSFSLFEVNDSSLVGICAK